MKVEIMLDDGRNKIYKCGHYLFTRDERTVVDGCAHTLYVIDLEYIPENTVSGRFEYELDPENNCKLNFDLRYILEHNECESKIISNEEFIKNFDTGVDNEDLYYLLCYFLDIDEETCKIVQLYSFIEHHCDFEIRHGGTCIVLVDHEYVDAETEEIIRILKRNNLNLVINTNALLTQHDNQTLQELLDLDSEIILQLGEELKDYYSLNNLVDFIHIVSEDVYNNHIKNKQVGVTLEDPDIYKYIDLYNQDKHKIRDADFIMELDGHLQNITKFSDIIDMFKSKIYFK